MDNPLEQLLGNLDETPRIDPDAMAEELRLRFERLQYEHTFRPGDLVKWKPGLKNTKWPQYGDPVLVLEVLDTPVWIRDSVDKGYFREPATLAVGIYIPSDGQMYRFGMNGARFEPFNQTTQAA